MYQFPPPPPFLLSLSLSSPPFHHFQNSASCSSGDYIREGAKNAKMEGSSKVTWVDYRVPVSDSPTHDPSDMAVVADWPRFKEMELSSLQCRPFFM